MAYATPADMAERFGDLELVELTDRRRSGQIDDLKEVSETGKKKGSEA